MTPITKIDPRSINVLKQRRGAMHLGTKGHGDDYKWCGMQSLLAVGVDPELNPYAEKGKGVRQWGYWWTTATKFELQKKFDIYKDIEVATYKDVLVGYGTYAGGKNEYKREWKSGSPNEHLRDYRHKALYPTLTDTLSSLSEERSYFIFTKGHVMAYTNGKLFDTAFLFGTARVIDIWELVPKDGMLQGELYEWSGSETYVEDVPRCRVNDTHRLETCRCRRY